MPVQVIIIGAGAAGLMAAWKLSDAGKQVLVVEARERPGGRIYTMPGGKFTTRIEAGAEFIHGKAPLTFELLDQAGLTYHKITGELWNARKNHPEQQDDFIEDQELLTRKLKEIKNDISVKQFLDLNFNEKKYSDLRTSVSGYVQGYDLANLDMASTLSLREEWTKEGDDEQYRIDEGYGKLIDYLFDMCKQKGCNFQFNTTIKKITWQEDKVSAETDEGTAHSGNKLILTIPLGILQARPKQKAYIEFSPSIEEKISAANSMGYGEVIKFILEFNERFWESKQSVDEHRMKNLGFVFSNTSIPTWWTQAPSKVPILTGWFGGPQVQAFKKMNDESLLQIAADSLSEIFAIDHAVIVEKLVSWRIFNWAADDYSLGGYAYNSLHREKYLSILSKPLMNTLFFSGEAMTSGPAIGTVEGALAAGKSVAELVLSEDRQVRRIS